ncbi:MAG: hypothetical protein JWO81_1936 [Alphaproteobacteria bacterium]|nr:hypothetical protein [Alphaproteobacteria bacterium]
MRILDVDETAPRDAGDLTEHLIAGEEVRAAFVSATGSVLFTDGRILLAQREHLLEERMETSSYPWREVRRFSLQESIGTKGFVQLRIWLGEDEHPLHLRARPGTDLRPLQRLLAEKLG